MMKYKVILLFVLAISQYACLNDDINLKIPTNTVPLAIGDNWSISSPEAEGFNPVILDKAVEMFFDENRLVTSKALLIAKDGKIVLESYCRDLGDRDELQNIKSVSKSITSLMLGAAIHNELIDSNLDRTVYSYIPEVFDDNLDKRAITVEQCLRMTTGLKDPVIEVWSEMLNGDNHLKTCLGTPLEFMPGYVYNYNNGNANILAGIIKKNTAEHFEDFTKKHLFDKIGISKYNWAKWGDGEADASYGLHLLPRDMLTIGQLALQNGQWNGEQLLPNNWMQKSVQAYEHGGLDGYGYHWWVDQNQENAYYAYGLGGQCIYISPEKNMVIVHVSGTLASQDEKLQIPYLIDLITASAE